MDTSLVKCLLPSIVIVNGIYTRNRYEFSSLNNHLLPVDNMDLEDILGKRQKQGGCCGVPLVETTMFELVK